MLLLCVAVVVAAVIICSAIVIVILYSFCVLVCTEDMPNKHSVSAWLQQCDLCSLPRILLNKCSQICIYRLSSEDQHRRIGGVGILEIAEIGPPIQ